MHLSQPRIPPLADDALTPEARAALAPLAGRGDALNIFRTMANHPAALGPFLAWASYVLSKASTLPSRTRELAILRTGFNCGSGYEWAQHVAIGARAGLSEEEIARIKGGPGAPGWSDADAAILAACDELERDCFVSDASWAALGAHYDTRQCMDLVYTVGQYRLVSMLLNSFGVQLDPGLTLDPDLDRR